MALSQWCACSVDVIKLIAKNMVAKFDKYWLVIHGIIGVATVLDPQYKMDLLEFYFPKLYENGYLEEVERVCQLCYDLLLECQTRHRQSLDRGVNYNSTAKSIGYATIYDDMDVDKPSCITEEKKEKGAKEMHGGDEETSSIVRLIIE
ncbi:hypothetical protein L1049_005207 [Liquidambar formosana]|uniref:hAT-like transposase RNase-H fold domain-containing protein n=1 Tax=Liquidambar formosana TaxID=63359 RepID=A0AAP0X1A2_LIQFO